MERCPVYIDPFIINSKRCFDNGIRNTKRAVFPGSKLGDCLKNAVISEFKRRDITIDVNIFNLNMYK